MTRKNILNSMNVARFICFPVNDEPKMEDAHGRSDNGVFLGNTISHSIPVILNFDLLVNPHLFIIGMTGSGKTYFMKSLMLKLYSVLDYLVIVIDFTGEYRSFAYECGREADEKEIIAEIDQSDSNILYTDLKNLSDKEKVSKADRVIQNIINHAKMNCEGFSRRTFIILDEAWKLLQTSKAVESVIREGRKYGIGIIFASQIVEDMRENLITNIASIFIFRLQDELSLGRLLRNYNLGNKAIEKIQNLEVGSCFSIFLYKSKEKETFVIRRILGIELDQTIKITVNSRVSPKR